MADPKRFIYFAHCWTTGLVKIGVTTNVKKRIRHLKVECGHETRLLTSWPGTHKGERELHRQFADSAAGHEWFRIEGALKEYLQYEVWGRTLEPHHPGRNRIIGVQNRRYTLAIKKNKITYDKMIRRIRANRK